MSLGVPVKLLHEAVGLTVTAELITGQTYRGKLLDSEDNMNIQLQQVQCTHRDGHVQHLEQAYIRGSTIRLLIVPDMLKNAPMFKNITKGGLSRGRGVGAVRGRALVARAQRSRGRGGRGGFRP